MLQGPRQEIFSHILEDMPEGVIFLDDEDVIRFCNQAAARIREIHVEKILGHLIYTIHPAETHERIRELLTSLKSGAVAESNRVVHIGERCFDNSYTALRNRAGDYLGTLLVSRDITEKNRLIEENLQLKFPFQARNQLVAHSEKMRRLLERVDAVAQLDSALLVSGENGTGKTLIVERLHQRSRRATKGLVRVNCAALPADLINAELFGRRSPVAGLSREDHPGKFVLAAGGTLFLDEITALPLSSQAELLRAIQEKIIQPVDSGREVQIDIRIIVATHHNLSAEVEAKRFRSDLFQLLNRTPLEVAPLRERREDILPLAEIFISQFCQQMKKPVKQLTPEVREMLHQHPFPGNVRQLKHAIERAVALGAGELIHPADLPSNLFAQAAQKNPSPALTPPQGKGLKQIMAQYERETLLQALHLHQGHKNKTAQALGISRKSLWEKLNRHKLADIGVTPEYSDP